ncbi:Zinc finger CCCH domain-containing protein 46 [Cardamine amara subsp. amara]|uniref:Zinc finger CCCH domain-containing protein 46 n=1 Tax=Cardamine amara subsp. amara TaxID=228776 RepID=A0ABD0ZSM7_CARAN
MDVYEATRIVLSRIQSLDPTNASKIMGLLLLQDHGEKEMIRLAFGPQNLLHSVIAKAKTELGLMADDLGFGLGHCSSYLCNCKFVHGGVDGSRMELLRSKSVPPRLAHQFTGGSPFQFSPNGANLLQGEAQRAASLMKLGSWRAERTDLSASRQIYLTFPADSMFAEEDVSNYFSTYGAVEDVRIPYQQKRMFGFVSFVYPETVKSILAKGNPHFVCDSRVLVKPYKEKGKVPDKYRSMPSPSGLDSRDLRLGTQDLLWKRRFEERALVLQSTRLMNLQLLDVNKHFQLSFDQTRLLVNQREGDKSSGSDEDTIKLSESLEDRLPESPFASPTHHFHTNGSGPQDESKTTLSESFKSFNCQMPSLSVMGMLPGPVCRVGI